MELIAEPGAVSLRGLSANAPLTILSPVHAARKVILIADSATAVTDSAGAHAEFGGERRPDALVMTIPAGGRITVAPGEGRSHGMVSVRVASTDAAPAGGQLELPKSSRPAEYVETVTPGGAVVRTRVDSTTVLGPPGGPRRVSRR